MTECVFCSIVRGNTPSTKVYEDESVVAFMDIKPITQGHIVVVPKRHAELLTELDDNVAGKMFIVAKKIGIHLKKSKLNCKGVNYILSDGAEAGQEVFHTHLHVIPRYRGDGFGLRLPPNYERETTRTDLERTALKITKGFDLQS